MVLMYVNDVALKNPSQYDPVLQNLASDSSFTSETGITNIDPVRNNISTLTIKWDRLTASELQSICTLISPDDLNKTVFSLRYFAMHRGSYVTGNFYVTDRNISTKKALSEAEYYSSLSVKLKEC